MSKVTQCEYCTNPITYQQGAEGSWGGPALWHDGVRLVKDSEAERFISSEQYLKIVRSASPYRARPATSPEQERKLRKLAA